MKAWTGKVREICRFCLAGGIGFVFDYGILYFATEYLRIRYLYSAGMSFTIAVLVNYWLCLNYVFRSNNRQNVKQVAMFLLVSFIGLGLNQVCMWILVEKVEIWYMMAKAFATVVVMIWNYIMKRMTLMG